MNVVAGALLFLFCGYWLLRGVDHIARLNGEGGETRARERGRHPALTASGSVPSSDHRLVKTEPYILDGQRRFTAECSCGVRVHHLPSLDACRSVIVAHSAISASLKCGGRAESHATPGKAFSDPDDGQARPPFREDRA